MATAVKSKSKQKFKNGTIVYFVAYDGDSNGGVLQSGDKLTVTGWDDTQDLYNVTSERVDEEGNPVLDSLFPEEFTLEEQAPVEAPKKTKTKAKVVEPEPEVEEEAEVEAPKAKKGRKKNVDEAPKVEQKVEEPKAKKSKKAKVEEEDEVPEIGAFKKTASVEVILDTHNGDALLAAKDLAETKERTIFTLGGVLAYIKRNNTFEEITHEDEVGVIHQTYQDGLAGFNTYVKAELGIEARSAAYYVDLYEMFSQVTTEAKIAKIGWTKLRELLPLRDSINSDNVDEWLDKAKKSTTAELHEKVTKTLIDAGEELHGNRVLAQQTKLTYVVHEDQANTVAQAIRMAKDVMGDDTSDSAALVYIMSEWMQLSMGEGADAESEE